MISTDYIYIYNYRVFQNSRINISWRTVSLVLIHRYLAYTLRIVWSLCTREHYANEFQTESCPSINCEFVDSWSSHISPKPPDGLLIKSVLLNSSLKAFMGIFLICFLKINSFGKLINAN